MRKSQVKSVRLIPLALASCLLIAFTGCGNKEEKPSAPGYYTGPMKSKSDATGKPGVGGDASSATQGK